jgi:2-oxo-4-hydroxy-4-carboxy--5-ureidoimidazoline (OHCU) decarboxylase
MTIAELDDLPANAFVAAVGPLFEGAPRFLARLADARPFGSVDHLFDRAREIALTMPEDEQRELLDAHPRLGAPPGLVSTMSFVEQGYDRETADAAAEAERAHVAAVLATLNDAYERGFGFRYCVFVAGRPRSALLPGFRAALERPREAELRRALGDVIAIARDRFEGMRARAAVR